MVLRLRIIAYSSSSGVCLQGAVLRLLTYLGLKYCNQRSKHNPVARAFTRMWMQISFYSKLHWWSAAATTPRSPPPSAVQEMSQSIEDPCEESLSVKTDLTRPLLG